ncbi:DoxX family protein [Lentisphaera profundi]|uniref:DoxX family protein n=1 Tax=Lentisphaera profundi TaxID=1658616 RepID=UPI003B673AD7
MLLKLINTEDCWAPVTIRTMAGIVMFAHGAQKLFGWFGGYGFEGTMKFMTEGAGLPALIAFLVIIGESIGSLMLVAGIATRFVAASQAIIMFGALKMHLGNGFFINWFGNQSGEGIEYHLLYIGMMFSLLISGAGKFSLDAFLRKRQAL